jgi:parallel beta-helix repeat protein
MVTLMFVCWIAVGVVCVQPIKAQYQGNIAINADGSITPSVAPIQQVGNIYTLTSDVTGSITVNGNNMVLDGNGHTIIYGGSGPGNVSTLSLNDVSNVTVENLTVTGSVFGIQLLSTSNVIVANNTITGTGYLPFESTAGIYVSGGGSNIITGNNLQNNQCGMDFYETENNLIVGNTIAASSNPWYPDYISYGLIFWGASNNTIYHNNFENNEEQAGDAAADSPFSINIWDDGYPGGGNYWSDYQTRYPKATEIDSSRIGDTPYVIDGQNKDRYPLMYAFNEFYVLQATPPKVSLLSPVNQTYNASSVPLVFTLDKAVNWIGYSLDGQQNVTLSGNGTITGGAIINDTLVNMTSGLHSITVYANDTFGNIGASQTINFSIAVAPLVKPEPFPTAIVAAVAGVSAVIVVGAGLFIYFKKRKRQA